MSDVDPQDPRITQARPGWAILILTLPLVMLAVVVLGYGAIVLLGLTGRHATGPEVTLSFTTCEAARPLVEARVADMGLPATFEEAPDGFRARIVLPADPIAAERIPDTLTAPGRFEVRVAGEPVATNADVVDASVRLDLSMTPSTLVQLHPEAAARLRERLPPRTGGALDIWIDGERVASQPAATVTPGEVEISPTIAGDRERMLATAEWSVTIDHGPLPCPVSAARAAEEARRPSAASPR